MVGVSWGWIGEIFLFGSPYPKFKAVPCLLQWKWDEPPDSGMNQHWEGMRIFGKSEVSQEPVFVFAC